MRVLAGGYALLVLLAGSTVLHAQPPGAASGRGPGGRFTVPDTIRVEKDIAYAGRTNWTYPTTYTVTVTSWFHVYTYSSG